MRSLASELARRPLRLTVGDPRATGTLLRLLKELGLSGVVEVVEEGGLPVPPEVLNSRDSGTLLACWLARQAEGPLPIVIGLDFGEKNIGLAIVVGKVVAYTCVLYNVSEVAALLQELARCFGPPRVKVGISKGITTLAEKFKNILASKRIKIELVFEDKLNVIVKDFSQIGNVSRHELDAVRVAFSPEQKWAE